MILSVSHIQKSFSGETVIADATFHLEKGEKAALVGLNGAGKSTLFKIINGDMEPDQGEISFQKDLTRGYLSQHADLQSDASLFEEVLSIRHHVFELEEEMQKMEKAMESADSQSLEKLMKRHASLVEEYDRENGYAVKSEVTGVLKGLGFHEEEFEKQVSVLSGGEKTRISLAKLLLTSPDLLLLDEPTNHLDINALTWLETYLLNYPGAVFVISHDRYFLEKLTTKIIDLSLGVTSVYSGTYSQFAVKKKQVQAAKLKEYEKQQEMIRHQEEVIEKLKSFNREKSIRRAESREKMLEKVERIEKPIEETGEMALSLTPNVLSGMDVLSIQHLKKAFGDRVLFEDCNIEIRRGEKVALIGDNGTGKSTLLKMITGHEAPDGGLIKYGANVYIGYYDQEHQLLSPEKTIFSEIQDTYPTMTNTKIRSMLAAFLFTGEDVYKLIADLSGGEKGRVALAKLMLSDANFLILDEPTNHLDMTSKEILEDAVRSYEGTVLSVSHDRYYINATSTRILELYHREFVSYIGNYDYYLEKKDQFQKQVDERQAPKQEESAPAGDLLWKKQKEEQARRRKTENDKKKIEDRIEGLEKEIARCEEELQDPSIATNSQRLNEILAEKTSFENQLESAYEAWGEFL